MVHGSVTSPDASVPYVWIVYPSLRTLEVLERADSGYALASAHFGETAVSAPPFQEVVIDLGPLWV